MSTMSKQTVRFRADADGLTIDTAGDITAVVVDVVGETAMVQLPDGSHVGLPLTAIPGLRDVQDADGGADEDVTGS